MLRKDTCFSVYHETKLMISLSFIFFFQLLRAFKGLKNFLRREKNKKKRFFFKKKSQMFGVKQKSCTFASSNKNDRQLVKFWTMV